jgi:hypothetical protein
MSDGATEIDLGITQALGDIFANFKWPNYTRILRGSCWSHVYIKNVLIHISRITGGKKNDFIRLRMLTDFKVLHQCSSQEQFDKAASFYSELYCNHELPAVQIAAVAITRAYLNNKAVKRNFFAGSMPRQNLNNCGLESKN